MTTVDTGFDGLTGLGSLFGSRRAVFEWGRREPFAAIGIGLTGFRGINDRLGHATGDEVLRQVARRIGSAVSAVPDGYVGRTGGDTFLLLAAVPAADSARRLAERIVAEIETPLRIGEATIDVRARAAVLMATESTALPGTFGSVDAIDITVDALKVMPRGGRPQVIIL